MTILKPAPEGKLPERDDLFNCFSKSVYAVINGKEDFVYYDFYNKCWINSGRRIEYPVIWYEAVELPDNSQMVVIYDNDKVNSILNAAMRYLDMEQLAVLRDCLIRRTA